MVARDLYLLYSENTETVSDYIDSPSVDWMIKAKLELHLIHVLTADLDSAFVCFTVIDEELERARGNFVKCLSDFSKDSHFAFIDDSILELKKITQKRSNCIQEKHWIKVESLSYINILSNAVIWILISCRIITGKDERISWMKNPRPFFPELTEEDLRKIEWEDPNLCLFNLKSYHHGCDPYLINHDTYHHGYNPCSLESMYYSLNPYFARSNSHFVDTNSNLLNPTTDSLSSDPDSLSPKPSSLGPNLYFFCSLNHNPYSLGPNWFMKPRFSSPRGSMRSQASSRIVNSIATPELFKYGRSTEEEIQKHFPILEESNDYDKIKNWEIPYHGYLNLSIKIQKHKIEAICGQIVRIKCDIFSNDYSTVEVLWYKKNRQIANSGRTRIKQSNNKSWIEIFDCNSFEDSGEIVCVAVDDFEVVFDAGLLVIQEEDIAGEEPYFIEPLTVTYKQCNLNSLKNDKMDSKILMVKENDVVEREHHFTELSTIMHKTSAMNLLGDNYQDTRNASYLIKSPIIVNKESNMNILKKDNRSMTTPLFLDSLLTITQKTIQIPCGMNIYLKCRVSGYPQPYVTFFKNNEIIHGFDKKYYIEYFDDIWILTVESSAEEDEGIYTAVASNRIDKVSSRFKIVVISDSLHQTSLSMDSHVPNIEAV